MTLAEQGPAVLLAGTPIDLVLCYDYQCPYSARVVRWLEGLGPDAVRPRYRMFPLEQINVDPTASTWRLWEQPPDYVHYRGRQDRRSLPAFVVTAILDEFASDGRMAPDALSAFRLGVYQARFDLGMDIADMAVLRAIAVAAGALTHDLDAALADPAAVDRARARIGEDWAASRARGAVFGVPTLILPDDQPVYLRLAREPSPDEAPDLLRRIVDLRRSAPWLLELKLAEAPAV